MASHAFLDALSETDIMVLKKVLVPAEGIAFLIRCIALGSVAGGVGLLSAAEFARADWVVATRPEAEKPQSASATALKTSNRPASAIAAPEAIADPVSAKPQVSSKQTFLKQQNLSQAAVLLQPQPEGPAELRATRIAQAEPSSDSDAESLRQKLVIDPLEELRPVSYTPGSSVGVPTAFGANYGDAFVGLSFSSRRDTVNEADGAITAGFGLGDSERYLGLEVSTNIGSLRRFSANGDISFKLHRALPGKSAIALGWDEGIVWGEENRNTVSTLYGVASKVFELRPGDVVNALPLTLTLGVGGGRFRSFENIRDRTGGVGVFGSVGLRVVPQASAIASWTGRDLNLGVSYVPIKTTPLYLTAVVGNVLSLNDNKTLFSFGIGYGFNYAGYQY